jgi:hypothetical protein
MPKMPLQSRDNLVVQQQQQQQQQPPPLSVIGSLCHKKSGGEANPTWTPTAPSPTSLLSRTDSVVVHKVKKLDRPSPNQKNDCAAAASRSRGRRQDGDFVQPTIHTTSRSDAQQKDPPPKPNAFQIVVRIHPPLLHSGYNCRSSPAIVAVPSSSSVASSFTSCTTRTALLVAHKKATTVVVNATPTKTTTTMTASSSRRYGDARSIGTDTSHVSSLADNSSVGTGRSSGASWWKRNHHHHHRSGAKAQQKRSGPNATVDSSSAAVAQQPASSSTTSSSRSFAWRRLGRQRDKSLRAQQQGVVVVQSAMTESSTVPTTSAAAPNHNYSMIQDWDAVYGPNVSSRQFYHQLVDSVASRTTTTYTEMSHNKDTTPYPAQSRHSLTALLSQGQSLTCLFYGAAAAASLGSTTPPRHHDHLAESNAKMDPTTAANEGFLWHVVQDLCAAASIQPVVCRFCDCELHRPTQHCGSLADANDSRSLGQSCSRA